MTVVWWLAATVGIVAAEVAYFLMLAARMDRHAAAQGALSTDWGDI